MDRKRYRIDHLLVAALFALMALIAFMNVLSRYLFHLSLAATEEITINLFVLMTVLGTGIAFERGAQLGMVSLYRVLPAGWRRGITVAGAVLSALLFAVVDWFVITAVYDEITLFHATSGALGVPVWIYYVGVPVCSVSVFYGIYRNCAVRLRELR